MATIAKKNVFKQNRMVLPFLFTDEKVKEKEVSKLDLFEKGLAKEIAKNETVQGAVEKMVKMALAAEFGTSILTQAGSQGMIDTITYGILHDSELRKQALVIIDQFAK